MLNQDTIPGFTVLRDGTEILNDGIFSMSIEFGIASLPKAIIQIDDGSWSNRKFDRSEVNDWKIGEKIELKIGYSQQHQTIFKGIIVKHAVSASEGLGSRLVIELRHEYYLSSLKRTNRIFLDKSDSNIISDIINDYGFTSEVDDLSNKHRQMIQFYSSDWDFWNMRAEANQMLVFPKNDKIVFTKNITAQTEKLTLGFGDNIAKMNLEIDSRQAFEEFKVQSWNEEDQKIVQTDSSIFVSKTAGDHTSIEIAQKAKHKDNISNAFGALLEQEVDAIANTNLQSAELIKVRGTIKCKGTSAVTIGDWIKLEGVSSSFNGKVLVTGVLDELSLGKWYTTFQLGLFPERYVQRYDNIVESPALGLLPNVHGLHIGIVSKLESDNDDEKILVQLPNLKEGEDAVWARCARMDAGNDRGWVFRPEIGDEVILGFINDDPRQAIILGSLHSTKNLTPIKAEDDNHHKGYVSREKLKVLFDDEKKIIRILTQDTSIILDDDTKKLTLKNPDNEIELSPEGVKIETQKDIKIKATGDLEIQAMNIKLKSDASFEAESAAGSKLKSSGMVEIKGAMVKIN